MAYNSIDNLGSIVSDPLRSFRFRVVFEAANSGTVFDSRITSFSGGFTSVGGLTTSILPIQYREGGYNTTQHFVPGMASFSPITLNRGVLWGNDQGITWMRGLFTAASGEGLNVSNTDLSATFRCNLKIYVMDHPNADGKNNDPRMMFLVRNAWLSDLNYSGLDASSNTVMMEDMTFQHEGLQVMFLNTDGTSKDANYLPTGSGLV